MNENLLSRDAVVELEPLLMRVAFRAVRSRALAQDLVQMTFLATIEHSALFDPRKGTLRNYMVGILFRKIGDYFRKNGPEHRHETLDGIAERRIEHFALDPRQQMDPSDQRTMLRIVQQTLSQLPPLQRVAVMACDVEQLDRAEAAAALGISDANLRVLLHRGRHDIRKALENAGL